MFDSFSHRRQIEALRKAQDGVHNFFTLRIVHHRLNKRPIYFDLVEFELPEVIKT